MTVTELERPTHRDPFPTAIPLACKMAGPYEVDLQGVEAMREGRGRQESLAKPNEYIVVKVVPVFFDLISHLTAFGYCI
jgi:hypothetical protein